VAAGDLVAAIAMAAVESSDSSSHSSSRNSSHNSSHSSSHRSSYICYVSKSRCQIQLEVLADSCSLLRPPYVVTYVRMHSPFAAQQHQQVGVALMNIKR
jgi:hypothetical protein